MSSAHKQRFNNQQTIGTEIQEQKVMRERDTKRSKVWQRQILRKRLLDMSTTQRQQYNVLIRSQQPDNNDPADVDCSVLVLRVCYLIRYTEC